VQTLQLFEALSQTWPGAQEPQLSVPWQPSS
jgi:hypothetical protein